MTPSLELVTTLEVDLGEAVVIGENQYGLRRRIVPIIGGRFHGPRLNGDILAHGADWNIGRKDGVDEVWARYTLQTHDGALIMITNPGVRRGEPGVEIAGKVGEIESWYFRTSPVFETSAPAYSWVTQSIFIGDLLPKVKPDQVRIDVYEVS